MTVRIIIKTVGYVPVPDAHPEQIVNVVIELSQMELPMQATGGKR